MRALIEEFLPKSVHSSGDKNERAMFAHKWITEILLH